MQSAASHAPAASPDREDIPVFSVVIAYEDLATGKRAKRACDFLIANLSREWQVTSQMWKFEVLGIPDLRDMAAKDAAMANLIIVSSRGDRELPAEVKAWIEKWLGYKGEAVALIGLFDCPPELAKHAQATQAYLESVARRGQLEFFTWPVVGPGKGRRQDSLLLHHQGEVPGETSAPGVALAPRQ